VIEEFAPTYVCASCGKTASDPDTLCLPKVMQ
jgi:DNA-directed RNA polymerase subunit RPC12/RpoP